VIHVDITDSRSQQKRNMRTLDAMTLDMPLGGKGKDGYTQAMDEIKDLANTLADIQIRCLAHALAAEGLGQEMTQELFGALAKQLPGELRSQVMGNAARTVLEWQQTNRAQGTVH